MEDKIKQFEKMFRFQDLEVWKRAADLSIPLFKLADQLDKSRKYRFAEQLRSAILSITINRWLIMKQYFRPLCISPITGEKFWNETFDLLPCHRGELKRGVKRWSSVGSTKRMMNALINIHQLADNRIAEFIMSTSLITNFSSCSMLPALNSLLFNKTDPIVISVTSGVLK